MAEEMPEYEVPLGELSVDLLLGMDVLRRYLTLFDFAGGMVWLQPYGATP